MARSVTREGRGLAVVLFASSLEVLAALGIPFVMYGMMDWRMSGVGWWMAGSLVGALFIVMFFFVVLAWALEADRDWGVTEMFKGAGKSPGSQEPAGA